LKLDTILPFIVLVFLIPLFISPETISAIDLDNEKFKVIVNFDYGGNPNTLRGSYQQDVQPLINDAFDELGLNTFDKTGQGAINNPNGYSYTVFAMAFQPVGMNPQSDDAIFQIYPLVRITGDKPSLSETEFDSAQDIVLAQERLAIVDFLQIEGATNVKTHLAFSFGGVDIDEGF
jgi:hypothetical protein